MSAVKVREGSRTAADTVEHVIHVGPCVLYAVLPELVTTGTITIRDSASAAASAPLHVSAIGLTQAGKDFGGVRFSAGLTVQLSVATDLSLIVWEAAP